MGRGPTAARQLAEAIRQPCRQLVDRQDPQARGGEFDGQRQTVQAAVHVGDRSRVLLVEDEARLAQGGPLDEQPHGRDAGQTAG
jgi:hypothetical protein